MPKRSKAKRRSGLGEKVKAMAANASAREARLREKRKAKKERQRARRGGGDDVSQGGKKVEQKKKEEGHGEGVEVEYVAPSVEKIRELGVDEKLFEQFEDVMERFMNKGKGASVIEDEVDEENQEEDEGAAGSDDDDDGAENGDDGENGVKGRMTRKMRKEKNKERLAEIKMRADRPEVVEVWDTSASDPDLLIQLKVARNSVPVPFHWCQKRKYLQGKRGLDKPAFALPDFIAATGITKMRDTYRDKEETQKLKQKSRERLRPKTGKMDIDYQVLHDAFFKYQTKPKMSEFGDLYYEGKEFEMSVSHIKPGRLSPALKKALAIPEGAPPPFLINMQRYGPPPSYPSLQIPGLNCPIPAGAKFGYHMGGWGKPPVDEIGNPIYGNVFDTAEEEERDPHELSGREKKMWGELEEEEESEEEEEESEEEEEEDAEEFEGDDVTTLGEDDMRKGISSVVSSLPDGEAADLGMALRKTSETPTSVVNGTLPPQGQLYQVLESEAATVGNSLMGSDRHYVIPGKGGPAPKGPGKEVTFRPEELEGLDEEGLAEKYAEAEAAEKAARQNQSYDFSDMVAEHAAGQKRKAESKSAKEKKKFKF